MDNQTETYKANDGYEIFKIKYRENKKTNWIDLKGRTESLQIFKVDTE
jgi:hypothetical protein